MEKREETNPVIFILAVIIGGFAVLIGGAIVALNWSSIGDSSMFNSSTPAKADVSRLASEIAGMVGADVNLGIEPINSWLVFFGMVLLATGSIVVIGAIIALLMRFGSKVVTKTKEDEDYKWAENELANREEAYIKQHKEDQPADPIPSHYRPKGTAITTVAIIAMLFAFAGITLAWNIDQSAANLLAWTVGSVVVGLIVGLLLVSPKRVEEIDSKDANPIPWGSVWVVVSGLIILGMGLGVVLYVTS